MSKAYEELLSLLREASTLASVGALIGWDQETMMPPGAGRFRAEQSALIDRLAHELRSRRIAICSRLLHKLKDR
jgi:carboxypeptidase Taq